MTAMRRLLLFGFVAAATPAMAASPPVDPKRFGARSPDLAYGAYQRGLFLTALNLAKPRAEAGDAAAQALVAEIYGNGLGVKRDPAEAAKWYKAAADQGVAEAQFRYGLILLDGEIAPKDEARGGELMKAAADAGNMLAAFNYAQLLLARDPGPKGLAAASAYYRQAADGGLPDAQFALAELAAFGDGVNPPDDAKAREWYEKAARRGFDTAQLMLGIWLLEGRGGPVDHNSGFSWLLRAARQGNVAAQVRVAKLYMTGIGVEPDSIAAAAWTIRARRAGLKDHELDDFMDGLTDEETKKALAKADAPL